MKAVFFDIDGTLYEAGKPIESSTTEALALLRERGHLLFICTGRSKIMIPKEVTALGFDGVVSACGTYGSYREEELFSYALNQKELDQMISLFRKYNAMYILEGNEYIYYDEETVGEPGEDWYIQYIKDTIPHRFVSVQKAEKIDAQKASIHARNVDPEELYSKLRGDYEVLEHVFGVAEFLPKGHSKAKGMERILQHLGLKREDAIAVGDSINDVDMLKYAGIGVCMGNGSEVAKACADHITLPIEEGGIFHAMKDLGLI